MSALEYLRVVRFIESALTSIKCDEHTGEERKAIKKLVEVCRHVTRECGDELDWLSNEEYKDLLGLENYREHRNDMES
jgi:hypothetical protein